LSNLQETHAVQFREIRECMEVIRVEQSKREDTLGSILSAIKSLEAKCLANADFAIAELACEEMSNRILDDVQPQNLEEKQADKKESKDLMSKFSVHLMEEPKKQLKLTSCRDVCLWLISKQQFDWFMGCVILLNSIFIGVETQMAIEYGDTDNSWPGDILDVFFIVVYMVEITIRIIAGGRSNLRDPWFLFDFCLVATGFLSNILLPIIFLMLDSSGDSGIMKKILIIRSMRLLRLVRAIRMLRIFRTVWRLVYGLLTSWNAMMSTLFLLLLVLYIFACLGIELITKDEYLQTHEETAWVVEYHFGSLQRTLVTLMAFVCADSVAGVYMPLVIHRPFLILYFVALLLTVSVALMNLVTAVLVEGALANASNDKELEKHDLKETVKKMVPRIMDMFAQYDEDGSGEMTREECGKVPIDILPLELLDDSVHSMQDIFDMLDVTGDGSLTQIEFADGLLTLLTTDLPFQTLQILKLLQVNDIKRQNMEDKLAAIENILKQRLVSSRNGSNSQP